jgi:hypothetical protein
MKTITTQRIVKVFIDDKHRKSFPLFMADLILKIPASEICKMSKGMRLNDKDHQIASPYVFDRLVAEFLETLKKTEPYIFELTVKNPVIGTRKVNTKQLDPRYELIFGNGGVKIKCPEHLYRFSNNKATTVNLNY